jgi:transcriptional regulator with XRE-family HTH domain
MNTRQYRSVRILTAVRKKAAGTEGFVVRLNNACDDVPHIIPPHGEGRQIELAKRMGMSQEGVRKWFAGEAMPRRDAMSRLAAILEVEEPWLALGITPEVSTKDRRIYTQNAEGAMLIVMGRIMLAGGSVAQPGPRDPNRDFIDFYAIMRGHQLGVHVTLARSTTRGVFQFSVPRQFNDCRIIGVVNNKDGTFDFIDMISRGVDVYKERKAGAFVVHMSKINGDYNSGPCVWKRIRNFEELV